MDVRPTIDVIASHLAEWDSPVVEPDIFGTVDPAEISKMTDAFCRRHLGAGIRGSLFYVSSIGSAHGLELDDGRRIVVKARLPASTNPNLVLGEPELGSIFRVTSWLFEKGFPCPEPLLGPQPLGRGFGMAERIVDVGPPTDGFDPRIRRILADGLFRLIETLRGLPGDIKTARLSPSFRGKVNSVFPQPHSKLFEFERTAAGAEWIDAFARRALSLDTYSAPPVLGHCDWRAEHVVVRDGAITAVFDWDSLGMRREVEIVGIAAHVHTADWSRVLGRVIPNADEIRAFIADYEAARGRTFSKAERQSLFANGVYLLAYGARCGHSLQPAQKQWLDGTMPGVLRRYGDELLREAAAG
jgi:hypothetical protein